MRPEGGHARRSGTEPGETAVITPEGGKPGLSAKRETLREKRGTAEKIFPE